MAPLRGFIPAADRFPHHRTVLSIPIRKNPRCAPALLILAGVRIGQLPARGSPSRSASNKLGRSAEKEACLNSGVLRLGGPRAGGVAVPSVQSVF